MHNNLTDDERNAIYSEGQAACYADDVACPYLPASEAAKVWFEGVERASRDMREAARELGERA